MIAYVPQMHEPPFPYKVIDVVVMGTNVKMGYFRSPGKKEYHLAESILDSLADSGMSIIMTSHSPEQSFLCSAKTVLIEKNNNILIGSPEEIVTEENMKKAYGATVKIKEIEMENGDKIRTCIPIL